MAKTHATRIAKIAHRILAAVFFGSGLRRAGTRFCARRNGDSFSASKSSRRASSSSSRAASSGVEYNSSWMVAEPLFAINRSVVEETAEPLHYNFSCIKIDRQKLVRFAQWGSALRAVRGEAELWWRKAVIIL